MIELAWGLGYVLISLVAVVPITKFYLKFFSWVEHGPDYELTIEDKQQIVFFSILWPIAILISIAFVVIRLYSVLINFTVKHSK